MADNKAELVVDGDVSPLLRKLREAGAELNRFGREGKGSVDSLGNAFGGLHSKVVSSLTGILSLGAIGAFVKKSKDAVVEAESSFRGLEAVANHAGVGIGRAMEEAGKLAADGMMTTAEASKALQNLLSRGYSIDQAVQTLMRLKDAAAFNRSAHLEMGEAVVSATEGIKNENSTLVDNAGVTKNVSKMWEEYAAQLGKGANQLTQAEKIQAEYNGIMRETEAQVGNAEKAMSGMQGQQAQLKVETQNLQIAIGQGLTPAFTGLARAGTWVVNSFAKPILWYFETLGIRAGALATKMGILWNAVTSLNFSGIGTRFDAADALKDEMMQAAFDKYQNPMGAFEPSGAGLGGAAGGAGVGAAGKTKKSSGKQMSDSEWAMEEAAHLRRTLYAIDQQRNEYHEAANKAVLEADKKLLKEMDAIHLLRLEGSRNAELARIAELEAGAQRERDLGEITHAEYLARLAEFNQQRLAAEQLFIEQKREVVSQDPEQNPVELERIEQEEAEIRRRYRQQDLELQRQMAVESQSIWQSLGDSISGLWDKGMQALLNGTLTWKNAMQAIGAEVVSWFATQVVGAMVKEWLAGKMKKLAALLGFTTAEKGVQAASTAATVAAKTAETTAVVGANAAQAGSGAAASQASIPIVGPVLALAAMAAVFAAVMAMGKKKSAMGGYDIPKGVNPMTQLHEEEMVLPKHLANTVRGMAAAGAGEGASGAVQPVNVNITSHNARGVRELFMDNPDVLAEAIRKAVRNGFK